MITCVQFGFNQIDSFCENHFSQGALHLGSRIDTKKKPTCFVKEHPRHISANLLSNGSVAGKNN